MTGIPGLPLIEKTTSVYTAQLVDELGVGVSGSALTTLLLTYYDQATGTKINGRNHQNVLNVNGVVVDELGNLAWTLALADTVILNDGLALETHVALFEATWSGGAKGCLHEVALPVRNVALVT